MKTLLPVLLLCVCTAVTAGDVYTWKSGGGNSYSDVPRHLKPEQSGIVNIRTHNVRPAVQTAAAPAAQGSSLADQQAKLNDEIAVQNKKIEEQNKQIAEENRQRQEDNCKAAQLNRQFAETARSNNREALIQRYEGDVKKYCN